MENNYIVSVTRHNVTKQDIENFVNEGIVKFIFIDKDYADISSDKTINEIHKLKSKYRGNTYIRIPLIVVKNEEDKYPQGIEITDSEDNAQGFVVVSKHDLRDLSDEMKKANKDKRVEYGKKLCEKHLEKMNAILKNNILKVTIKDNENNLIKEEFIKNDGFEAVNKNITNIIENIR
jgi:hypothetical protein